MISLIRLGIGWISMRTGRSLHENFSVYFSFVVGVTDEV